MKRIGKKFNSLQEADRAEDEYYQNLSPNRRVEILLELIAQHGSLFDESTEGFERVFRVVPLSES